MEKHLLIVLSGPSGVGKGTIVNELNRDGHFAISVSYTTRAPREGEKDGRDYFFVTKERFDEMVEAGAFLEYNGQFDSYYGTPRTFVEERLKEKDVILEIDVDGGLRVKSVFPQALLIMIVPPSREELRARLIGRGTETEEKVEERLARYDYEISKRGQYDCVLVNDRLADVVAQIQKIISERKVMI